MIHQYNNNFPSYSYYKNMLEKMSKKYLKKYNKLLKEYKKSLLNYNETKYFKILKLKRKCDLKVIKRIIFKFKKVLKRKNMVIFFHGSYVKKLNRWNSDIDINFLYLEDNQNDFVLEELIVCAIYKILGYPGRDKIHTMMLYLPNIKTFNGVSLSKNYVIKFPDDNLFNYECRKNYENIYPKILNSSRYYKDFCDYVCNAGIEKEWVYSYEGLTLSDDKIIKKLLKNIDNYLYQNQNLYYCFIKQYKKELKDISLLNINTIADLNSIIKMYNLNKVYTMLLILKEFIVIMNGKCINIDINEIKNNKIIKNFLSKDLMIKFFVSIYKYVFFLDRIENLCKDLNINFSSREESEINMNKFIYDYNQYYKSDFVKDYEVYFTFLEVSKKILERIEKYER